jgi:hypothetical protein
MIRSWLQGVPVPADIAVCPACAAALTVEVMAMNVDVSGDWRASEIVWDCAEEPDRDCVPAWHVWLVGHQVLRVQERLELEATLLAWLTAHVRFREHPHA